MNFEPPDFTKDVAFGNERSVNNGTTYPKTKFQDCSPLLRADSPHKYINNNGLSNNVNRNMNQQYKAPIHNRLGNRNFQHRNNNISDQMQINSKNLGQRNFNRKRPGDGNLGPVVQKRKWVNKPPFYQNLNTMTHQNNSSVQNRLNRVKNTALCKNDGQTSVENSYSESNPSYFNDSQEVDPTDITVQVVNSTVSSATQDDQNLVRFKMVLDLKAQTAIRLLQQKRKDKQVIYPLPVTPNVTGISLHERFSHL